MSTARDRSAGAARRASTTHRPRMLCVVMLCAAAARPPGAQAAAPFRVRVAGAPQVAPAQVFAGFGCRGGNRSPALAWTDPPAGTRSLAITVFDRDAPTGSGWWHWIVYDLPATLRSLAEGAGDERAPRLPPGAIQGRTDFGTHGYGGPCPPAGDRPHRYVVTVWALDVARLPIDRNASGAMAGHALSAHALAKAQTTLLYGRR